MKVAEVRSILGHLQNVYAVAGAKGPAKDLKILADVLLPHADTDLSDFVLDLSAGLSRGKETPKARRAAVIAPKATLNEGAIATHVNSLRDAGTQPSQFEMALERLKADSSLTLAEVAEVARIYSNSVTKYRSLAAAHKDISQAFVRRARFENKLQ